MFQRLLIGLLIVLALRPDIRAQDRTKAAPAQERVAVTGYDLLYRRSHKPAFVDYGTYRDRAAAEANARKLEAAGFQTQILPRTAMVKVPPRPTVGLLVKGLTVSKAKAHAVFANMAAQRDIAFRFPVDGCYARAHLMVRRMQADRVPVFKVWTFQNGDPLFVRTANHPRGYVTWKYHVAPMLRVRISDKEQRWWVVDPSMFGEPVPVDRWVNAQRRPGSRFRPFATLTKIGLPPKDATGKLLPGTGYWPAADPAGGPDSHAYRVMRAYKPWEGREPPRDLRVEVLLRPFDLFSRRWAA